MKNWYKTFELATKDIIVMKGYSNESDDKENPYTLVTFSNHDGFNMKTALGFPDEESRDEAFQKVNEDFARKMASVSFNLNLAS